MMNENPTGFDNVKSCRKKGNRCRRVAGQRRSPITREQKTPTSSLLSTTLLMGLASMASMISPIAAASLHTPYLHMSRKERRARGERNTKRIKLNTQSKDDDNEEPIVHLPSDPQSSGTIETNNGSKNG